MVAGTTTSIRMLGEVRELYELLAHATGRARDGLMVEVLKVEGQRRLDQIAGIPEGRPQSNPSARGTGGA